MSKTYDASSLKAVARTLWKRCAASVTGLWSKYRADPFFRTEVNVVLLQVAFALVILGLVGASFSLLYHDVSIAIVEGIRASLAANAPSELGPTIVREIEQIRTQNLIFIVSLIGLTTVLFGYIIARITLAPARTALTSQKQFIGNIAHELRTPLSVIKTNTEVALLDTDMTKSLREVLSSNVEELDRISSIINNLLSLSALISPEQMKFEALDILALAEEVAGKLASLARFNGQTIRVYGNSSLRVWGNRTALSQVMENILKNALHYSPKDASVELTIEYESGSIRLSVKDSGLGIAQKDLQRIFEPFYRAESSRTRRTDGSRRATGSGLGLAIVSELVKLHRGRIIVRSKVGEGTTVIVSLPQAAKRIAKRALEETPATGEVGVDFSRRR